MVKRPITNLGYSQKIDVCSTMCHASTDVKPLQPQTDPDSQNEMTSVIRARCYPDQRARLMAFARKYRRDSSDVIRAALEAYISAEEDREEGEKLARTIQAAAAIDPALAEELRKKALEKLRRGKK